MDEAHKLADYELDEIRTELEKAYATALREMRKKQADFMGDYEASLSRLEAQLQDGDITDKEYKQSLKDLAAKSQWLDNMVIEFSMDMSATNSMAASIINGRTPGIYAENFNYGTYEVESKTGIDTMFTMYDENTVRRLLAYEPPIPKASVKKNKDIDWNSDKFRSALTQGILQGESMKQIAERINTVGGMNYGMAMRTARTMVTAAENGGRIDSYKRAQDMGIEMQKQWLSTLDGRTRHSHRLLDDEKVDVDEPFSNGLMFPGDPDGEAGEIYNCRCTLIAAFADEQYEDTRYSRLGNMSYQEWKEEKQNVVQPQPIVVENVRESYLPRTVRHLDTVWFESQSEHVRANAIEQAGDFARFMGTDAETAISQLEQGLNTIIDNSEFAMRMRSDSLMAALLSGSFKNAFELRESGATMMKIAPYLKNRRELESDSFSVPTRKSKTFSDSDRPIYGLLLPKLREETKKQWLSGAGTGYGDGITVVFDKKKVFNNTTMTMGDSLNNKSTAGGMQVSDVQFSGSGFGSYPEPLSAKMKKIAEVRKDTVAEVMNDVRSGEYFEIQIHGAESHGIDCIDRIVINDEAIRRANRFRGRGKYERGVQIDIDELYSTLDALDIPYEIIGKES